MSPRPDLTTRPWHACETHEALQRIGSDAQIGLTAEAARQRLAEHGANALPLAPSRPLWRTLARQFKSPLIYILFVAAVLAVALGRHGDAVVILVVVVVNALIGAFQEYRAEQESAMTLALGNPLGSKPFNVMIMAVDDLIYRRDPLLADLAPVHANTAVGLVATYPINIALLAWT